MYGLLIVKFQLIVSRLFSGKAYFYGILMGRVRPAIDRHLHSAAYHHGILMGEVKPVPGRLLPGATYSCALVIDEWKFTTCLPWLRSAIRAQKKGPRPLLTIISHVLTRY